MRVNPKIYNHLGKVIKCGQKKNSAHSVFNYKEAKTRTIACHNFCNSTKINRNKTLIFVTAHNLLKNALNALNYLIEHMR
jgi:hypothetical protein